MTVAVNIERWVGVRQRSEEWREGRIGRLTGSRFAGAIGVHPHQSVRGVMREMAREMATGEPARVSQSADMARGVEAEPEILERWLHGVESIRVRRDECEFYTGAVCSADGTHDVPVGFSPDAVYVIDGERVLVECKCPRRVSAGGVPEHYMKQVQLGLILADCSRAVYVEGVIDPDGILDIAKQVDVEPDPEFLSRHHEQMWVFYRMVEQEADRILAEPDAVAAAAEPDAAREASIAADAYWRALAEERAAGAAHDAAKAGLDAAKALLVEAYGGAGLGDWAGLELRPVVRKGGIDEKALAADGVVLDHYRKPDSEYVKVIADAAEQERRGAAL